MGRADLPAVWAGGSAGGRNLDRAAGAEALDGGVGQDEGFAAVGEGGGGGRAGLHRGDEVVQFGPVGGLVALAEEVQVGGRRLAAVGAGVADAGRQLVLGGEHAGAAERLDPLVVAEAAAAAVGDLGQRAVGRPQHHDRAVDVARV